MTEGRRQQKVAQMIRLLMASLLLKGFRDPRIQGMITVTHVEMTSDLKLARIHVSILSQDEKAQKECLKGLKHASPFIRSNIGKSLELRFVPEIEFKLDQSLDYSYKIDELLKKI